MARDISPGPRAFGSVPTASCTSPTAKWTACRYGTPAPTCGRRRTRCIARRSMPTPRNTNAREVSGGGERRARLLAVVTFVLIGASAAAAVERRDGGARIVLVSALGAARHRRHIVRRNAHADHRTQFRGGNNGQTTKVRAAAQ